MDGDPGEYQLLVRLAAGQTAQRRFWFASSRRCRGREPGSRTSGIATAGELFRKVWEDFPEPLDRLRFRWETADKFWTGAGAGGRRLAARRRRPAYLQASTARRSPAIGRAEDGAGRAERHSGAGDRGPEKGAAGSRDRGRWKPRSKSGERPRRPLPRRGVRAAAHAGGNVAVAAACRSMRLAVEDQRHTFPDRYPRAAEFLARIGSLDQQVEASVAGGPDGSRPALCRPWSRPVTR